MLFKRNKQREMMLLTELHYIYGIEFPFSFAMTYNAIQRKLQRLRKKANTHRPAPETPHRIKRHECRNFPKNPHIISIWRHR